MLRICFVCLGNICRSPMAEFMLKDKLNKLNLQDQFYITSRATSYEEEGHDMYPKAKQMLQNKGITFSYHQAKRLEKEDYNNFDYFIGMEKYNINSMLMIFGSDPLQKISLLLDHDIEDPWYSDNFQKTYQDLDTGLDILITKLTKKNKD